MKYIYVCPKCEKEFQNSQNSCVCGASIVKTTDSEADQVFRRFRGEFIEDIHINPAAPIKERTEPFNSSFLKRFILITTIFLVAIGFSFSSAGWFSYLFLYLWLIFTALIFIKLNHTDLVKFEELFKPVYFSVVFILTFALVSWLDLNVYINSSSQYYSCLVKKGREDPPKSNLTDSQQVMLILFDKKLKDVSPISLNYYFKLGGKGTDLQRENLEDSIKDEVVVWRLKVYEIHRSSDDTYRVTTSTGVVDDRTSVKQMTHGFLDIGSIASGGVGMYSERYENQNIGTHIELTMRSPRDASYLGSLQTGSWITIRGKITGITLRRVTISPAVLEDSNNQSLFAEAFEKKSDFEKRMSVYKNRTCKRPAWFI
jgi:hypothetical protein